MILFLYASGYVTFLLQEQYFDKNVDKGLQKMV
jgi:hypothetical protein